jgi:hypothetical protein
MEQQATRPGGQHPSQPALCREHSHGMTGELLRSGIVVRHVVAYEPWLRDSVQPLEYPDSGAGSISSIWRDGIKHDHRVWQNGEGFRPYSRPAQVTTRQLAPDLVPCPDPDQEAVRRFALNTGWEPESADRASPTASPMPR